MRRTGIPIIGDAPWGSHFCNFYQDKHDLLEILVPYFKTGLEDNEFCIFIASPPLEVEEMRAALEKEIGDLSRYLGEGQLEFLRYDQWYTANGGFEAAPVLQGWVDKLASARARGFEGLRLAANTSWLTPPDWERFAEYEEMVNNVIGRHRMLAACLYDLGKCGGAEILDVAANHGFALIRRAGEWQTLTANRDAAARQQAEEALRAQREWLKVTLNSIGDAVLATDTSGSVSFLNPVAARLTGWKPEEALGRPAGEVFRVINELTSEYSGDIVGRVLENGSEQMLANHTLLVSRDGREIPVEDSAAPIRDAAGRMDGVVLVFRDVTEKREAQEALRRSEQRVRLKLNSILSPEGDVGSLELADVVDAPAIQSLLADFQQLVRLPLAIIDLQGNVVVGLGWQDICTKFHRANPETCRHCIESDTELSAGVAPGEFRLYRCKNKMWDIATPLVMGGRHSGNLFMGQVFFEDEPVDREGFRKQAARYGFDEEEYLAALERVPRVSRQELNTGISFLMKLGHMLSQLSYSNIKLARSLAERDRLTDSLRESGQMLARAQEIAHLGSWELDLPAGKLSWSDEVYRIFGLEPREFDASYAAFLEAVHPEDRAAVDAAYSGSVAAGEAGYEVSHRVVRKGTGEVRWVHEKCEHQKDASGRIVRSIGMVQDITGRKLVEEALGRADEQRRVALEAGGLGSWDYRFDTGEVFWDARCRDLFGIAEGDQIPYDGAIRCIHPDDRAAVDQAVKEALGGARGGEYHMEFRVVWPDGSAHWVSSHGRVFFEGMGESRHAVRFSGVNLDITESKHAEEQWRHAQKLESVGLLAGGIAHDFNNLLVGVIGNASLALDMLPPDSPAIEILNRINESGERAAHLTRQMLAYAGKGRFLVEPVDLSKLVMANSALIQSSLSKRISLQFDLDPRVPAVETDPSQMQQIFMNLVLNAGEAIGDNVGDIRVATGEAEVDAAMLRGRLDGWDLAPGRYAFLQVRDSGHGMDDATRARIFDPFFSTKFQGRGLGLAAVAGIVRAHKGAIEVTSAPGAGAMFRVLLPAMPPAAGEERDGGETILVVEDDRGIRELARRSLERQGFKVLAAAGGQAALDTVRAASSCVRVVVFDLGRPGAGSEESLARLARLRPDLDIVVSSGHPEHEALAGFEGLRVAGFLQKPYTVQELARQVKQALSGQER